MKTQEAIIELVTTEPLPAAKIASHLGISEGYIRTTLKSMELGGLIEKVDERLPYYYRPAPPKEDGLDKEKVKEIKKRLLKNDENEKNPLIKAMHMAPKSDWTDAIPYLKHMAAAIEDLNEQGLLIDTL